MAGERKKKGSEQIGESYQGLQDAYINTGTKMAQTTRSAHLGYVDDANKAQAQLMQDMADIKQAEANRWANYAGGVEALITERQNEIARAQQEAVADYNASQRAAQATGLTHLASSIANLIGVGGFNASNQVYQNPSMDWMKKADQDKFINRQRIDNLRERQRAIQQHLLDIKAQGEGALIGYDREAANIKNQFGMNMAGARRDADLAAARYEAEGAINAAQAGAQGASAVASARNQEASLGLQQDRLNAEKDRYAAQMRAQGYNPDGSINPAYMQEAQVVARATGGGGGKKDDDLISFRVNEYQDMPQLDWQGSAAWLENTLLSSIDTIDDITDRQKTEIKRILNSDSIKADEKGRQLARYIGTSKQLRDLIRRENQANTPQTTASPASAGLGGNTSTSGGYIDYNQLMSKIGG